jgi:hypothetical protein
MATRGRQARGIGVMVLGRTDQQRIEEIIRSISCSKDFVCYTSGFRNLCKVMRFAGGQMLECMARPDSTCEFRAAFGWGHICRCPVRRYIAQELQR